MSTRDEKLTLKGRREPTIGVAQQAEYSIGLYTVHKADLNRTGFTDAKAQQMGSLLEVVKTAMGTQKQSWDDAHAKTRDEAVAGQFARSLISKLLKALPMALRETSSKLNEDDFRVGTIRESTSQVIGYIDRVLPHLGTLEAALTPYFQGESPTTLFRNAKAALESADRIQEVTRGQAPTATSALYLAKGQLLELIEDMNRVAAIAFHGQADVIGRFNKDILLRARSSKAGKADPAETPAPAPAPAPAKPS